MFHLHIYKHKLSVLNTCMQNNLFIECLFSYFVGILNKYDGFFKCVLYHNDTFILAEKQVEVHVISKYILYIP